jgi:hypothetical protein
MVLIWVIVPRAEKKQHWDLQPVRMAIIATLASGFFMRVIFCHRTTVTISYGVAIWAVERLAAPYAELQTHLVTPP